MCRRMPDMFDRVGSVPRALHQSRGRGRRNKVRGQSLEPPLAHLDVDQFEVRLILGQILDRELLYLAEFGVVCACPDVGAYLIPNRVSM